jgi:hypothetical protein
MDEYNQGKAKTAWNPSHFFGLIYPDNTRKDGAAAFILCSQFLPGAEYRPELPERAGLPPSVTALYFRGKDGRNALILWNDSPGTQPLRLAIPAGTEWLNHDISSGATKPISGDMRLSLTRTPVFISWNAEIRIEGGE